METNYRSVGFPGCVGAVDCCNIKWKNFPLVYKGQCHNPEDLNLATIKLEAWCDSTLCIIWHWFGRSGTTNDKTIVSFSRLFQDRINGKFSLDLPSEYTTPPSTMQRRMGYFLVNAIYPPRAICFGSDSADGTSEKRFTKR